MKLENVSDVYPLSPTQEGMLFHTISDPKSGVYIDHVVVSIKGSIDLSRLAVSFQKVAALAAPLRTAFVWDGLDQPRQVVREKVNFPSRILDWSEQSPEQQSQALIHLISAEKSEGFQLEAAPLIRVNFCRLGPNSCNFVLCFHHLILDGWSAHILLENVWQHYTNGNLPASAFRFRDYIQWLHQQDHAATREFWRKELAGFTSPNRTTALPRPSDNGSVYPTKTITLSASQSAALKAFARQQRVTLNTLFQAAWSLVISRYSGGDDDIVFGTTVAGRPLLLPNIEEAIGSFINTLPFRTSIDQNQPLVEWFKSIQSRQAEYRDWEFSSLREIQKVSESPPGQPLFESILVFENYPSPPSIDRDFEVTAIEHFEQSNYPLALLVLPAEQIELHLVFSEALFPDPIPGQILEHVQSLLNGFVARPQSRVADLAPLPPAQQEQLISPQAPSPALASAAGTILDHISRFAKETPDSIALRSDHGALSYLQLDQQSSTVADYLIHLGIRSECPVGLCFERSIDLIVSMIGILKAGGAYLPLDPRYPSSHFLHVLEDCQATLILTSAAQASKIPPEFSERSVTLDQALSHVASSAPRPTPSSGDLAYLIYTSGSTGKPKGVMVTHHNLLHSTLARTEFYDTNPAQFLLLSSFAFDSSVAGIFWTLATGGCLILPPPDEEKDLDRISLRIARDSVTHLLCLPALYQLLLEHAPANQLGTLQNVIVAGEIVPTALWSEHSAKIPSVQLHNEYGPTEGTVWAIAHRLSSEDGEGPIPLGRAIPSTEIHLLDNRRNPAPLGAKGELYISGLGVARGYCNSPELTAQRFVELSFGPTQTRRCYATGDLGFQYANGKYGFLGRSDRQVKIRGFRVELGEIENVLRNLPNVVDAIVQVTSGSRLIAHVCAPTQFHAALTNPNCVAEQLPDFMTPDVIVPLDAFPQLANGKTDYSALPSPPSADITSSPEPARNLTEKTLAEIWAKTLKIEAAGIHDNFFSLGGDSILSIQIISRARRAGIHLEPRHINDHPTIAGLATISLATSPDQDILPPDPSGSFPLTSIQSWFFSQNLAAPQHWNQSALFELSPSCDRGILESALTAVVVAHPQLHARFQQESSGKWSQSIATPSPSFTITRQGFDASDDTSFEAACMEIQASLNLSDGPLFRVVHFTTALPNRDRLLFAIHHLVTDAVSRQIIIDDLLHAYQHPDRPLPPPTSAFSAWAHHLQHQAHSTDTSTELPQWIEMLDHATSPPLQSSVSNLPTEKSIITISRQLDLSSSTQLRSSAHQAYHTNTQDLLLTALALGINESTSAPEIVVDLESHGRPQSASNFDFSRTVGWFTSVHPVKLVSTPADLGQSIRTTKEHLRKMGEVSLKFGLLRYLNPETAPRLIANPSPWILFNFLGDQTSNSLDSNAPFQLISSAGSSSRSPLNTRDHSLEVNASFVDAQLHLSWASDPTQFDSTALTNIAERFESKLRDLLLHCESKKSGFTPSDFPESDLPQGELDDFLSEFE